MFERPAAPTPSAPAPQPPQVSTQIPQVPYQPPPIQAPTAPVRGTNYLPLVFILAGLLVVAIVMVIYFARR
jgi:hypothetical protein